MKSLIGSLIGLVLSCTPSIPSHIYWTGVGPTEKLGLNIGGQSIFRASLDGSNVEFFLTAEGYEPRGLALDVAGGQIYWTYKRPPADGNGKIFRASLDGGSKVEILRTGRILQPRGLALDVAGGQIYWTDGNNIARASLDRSKNWTAMDVNKMYWDSISHASQHISNIKRNYKIQQAPLDRSNVDTLVTGLKDPRGLALDGKDGQIYWTDENSIFRVSLNGSNVDTLVTGLKDPRGLALDGKDGQIYWTDENSIFRASLNGSNVDTLVTGIGIPTGIVLGP